MGLLKVAFVTGGYSGEAEISYKSAITIMAHLDTTIFEVYKIDIRTDGWWYQAENKPETPVDKNDFSITTHEGVKINFDCIFIGIHGTPGEDGKLQGYFDMLKIPYTSCAAAPSAITFNKRYTVAIAAMSGIDVAKSVHIFNNTTYNIIDIQNQLQFPVFVKPNNGGSSIGMSKVNLPVNLQAAINKAFLEDTQVLIEEFITGPEFTIGVYKTNNIVTTLPITQIIAKNEFFDFEAKYTAGASQEITPANLDDTKAQQIQDAAKKLYNIFNCSGVIRIDFIYNNTLQKPYMLEINTVPGQSAASIIPQQVKAANILLKHFYTSLIMQSISN